jgi:hypothetical protein
VLLVGAEGAHLLEQRAQEGLGGAGAITTKRRHQPLFAVLLAGLVEGLGHPVGVEGEDVVGFEPALPHVALPFREEPEHGRGGGQPLDLPVVAHHEGRQVAAVDVAQVPGLIVVVGEEKAREGAVG